MLLLDGRASVAGPAGRRMRHLLWVSVVLLVLAPACAVDVPSGQAGTDPAVPSAAAPTTGLASPSATSRSPSPSATTTRPSPSVTPSSTTSTSDPPPTAAPEPPSLAGERRNAFAFAPLDDAADVTVEGRVSIKTAWSTSKVLVVAAFLDTAAGGKPDRVSDRNRRLIKAALTQSDNDAVLAIRSQIRGRPGPAITEVLRAIGDTKTVVPNDYQGLMSWSIREQVRFMAALANGEVVSRAASAYLVKTMRPVPAQAWGLGKIGATAYKGGWYGDHTVNRQMGIVDGYAVAIITGPVSPAARRREGASAQVKQLNRIARLLKKRLAYETTYR